MDPALVKKHYEHLADSYDEFLYWSPDFVGTLTDKIVEMLRLTPGDRLLDLGGGTGMYAQAILERVPLNNRVTVVDPFPQMLSMIPKEAPIDPVAADAVDYSSRAPCFDKVLMKEAVHHVDRKYELFINLFERLEPGGRILLVHVDPNLVEYPLFDAALDNARRSFARPDEIVALLKRAGFEACRDQLAYRHEVPTGHYHRMVEGRYMSILTGLEDEVLQEGLKQMRDRDAGTERLSFTETFSYVLGTKAA
ncbi:MAG TPA: class I SAM-dependent methyltransferase [Actinomycetota bacterium]|nr:class I SAM-dependent methyltransferase [Actinomycetota bacterium]